MKDIRWNLSIVSSSRLAIVGPCENKAVHFTNLKKLHDLVARYAVACKQMDSAVPTTEDCKVNFRRVQSEKALLQLVPSCMRAEPIHVPCGIRSAGRGRNLASTDLNNRSVL